MDKTNAYGQRLLDNEDIILYLTDSKGVEETVSIANKIAKSGEVVLFSPASASFDMFKNFMERGDLFKELVNRL